MTGPTTSATTLDGDAMTTASRTIAELGASTTATDALRTVAVQPGDFPTGTWLRDAITVRTTELTEFSAAVSAAVRQVAEQLEQTAAQFHSTDLDSSDSLHKLDTDLGAAVDAATTAFVPSRQV